MTASGSSPARPARGVARWWLAGGTFVVGLLVGVLIAGLLITNSPEPGAADGTSPSGGTTSAPSSEAAADTSGATVEILVNEPCLRAINAAQDAYGAIERIAGAITDLDFAALDGIVRELQPLQAALRDDVAACEVSTRLPDGSVVTTAVEPTPTDDGAPPSVVVTTPTR